MLITSCPVFAKLNQSEDWSYHKSSCNRGKVSGFSGDITNLELWQVFTAKCKNAKVEDLVVSKRQLWSIFYIRCVYKLDMCTLEPSPLLKLCILVSALAAVLIIINLCVADGLCTSNVFTSHRLWPAHQTAHEPQRRSDTDPIEHKHIEHGGFTINCCGMCRLVFAKPPLVVGGRQTDLYTVFTDGELGFPKGIPNTKCSH